MKTKLILIAALFCAVIVQAQTSSTDWLTPLGNAISSSTNWAVGGGAGRATTGNRNLAFAAVAYNFNNNVGIIVGEDYLWAPHQNQQQQNSLKGGLTLSANLHPLAFIGSTFLTNVVGTPYVSGLIAQPSGGSSQSVATLAVAGINFKLATVKNFDFDIGGAYENRSGSGYWNGNYPIVNLFLVRRF